MKKILLLFFVCVLFVNMCFSASKNTKQNDYTPTENNVRLLGRTITKNKIAVLSHSASGIEFNVNAKKLSVTLIKDSWHRDARIVAFLNNERIFDDILKDDTKEFVLFDSEEVKTGVIRIIKVTECMMANAGIKKITTDSEGFISPTKAKKYKIEFIGDSATAAYGVDETNPIEHFKIETEDITKSYAYKTALELDADFSIICASGWGVYSGTTDGPRKKDFLIPDVYDKLGVTKNVSVDIVKPGETKWDFSLYKPDIITILLGTNDQAYTKGLPSRCNEFKEAYVKFIKNIRSKNPDAYILCCSGISPDELYPQIKAAVEEYQNATGDKNVGELHLPRHDVTEGFGADFHPTDLAYTNAARFLIPELKKLLK